MPSEATVTGSFVVTLEAASFQLKKLSNRRDIHLDLSLSTCITR